MESNTVQYFFLIYFVLFVSLSFVPHLTLDACLIIFVAFKPLLTIDDDDVDPAVVCGDSRINIRNNVHTIFSPLYPNNYPTKIVCDWFVTASLDKIISIQYVDFNTEKYFDTLSIGKGPNITTDSRVLVTSSDQSPSSVIIDSPNAWIRFKSDSWGTFGGFKLRIEEREVYGEYHGQSIEVLASCYMQNTNLAGNLNWILINMLYF